MKKVSFIKDRNYKDSKLSMLDPDTINMYFIHIANGAFSYKCTESFTAEITVKIVPYEQV